MRARSVRKVAGGTSAENQTSIRTQREGAPIRAGVIFARDKFEGTFPLAAAQLTTADAPDLVIALRWTEKANQFGTAG